MDGYERSIVPLATPLYLDGTGALAVSIRAWARSAFPLPRQPQAWKPTTAHTVRSNSAEYALLSYNFSSPAGVSHGDFEHRAAL